MEKYNEPKKSHGLISLFLKIIKPHKNLTVSEWADEERILPQGSAEAGRWRSSRTPFMIPIVDAFDDPRYKKVICSCGSQMGKSEGLLNIIGKRFHYGLRVPILFIQPSEKLARSFANDRLGAMFDTAKGLGELVGKGHKEKILERHIAGVRLGIGWAGSATELASHPAGVVLLDEVDRMASDVSKEGDPVVLAEARTKNYHNSKLGCFSTPTIEGDSKITELFYTGTMGKWSWICPHCKERFVPEHKLIEWETGATVDKILKEAYLACPSCGSALTDLDKVKMNKEGCYLYHTLDSTDDDEKKLIQHGLDPPANTTASFWVSGIASPWQKIGELAEILAVARRSKNEETLKACLNTFFGETYKQKGVGHKWDSLRDLIGQYEEYTIPDGVQLLTLGADVQGLGIYWTVRGWGYNSESWKIASGFLAGETEFEAVWKNFSQIIDHDFDGMRIRRAFIDSGFNTNQVYLFARRFPAIVFPTKGQDHQSRPLIMSKVDLSVGGKIKKGGVKLFHVDTHFFKSWLYSRYKWGIGESGAFHLDSDTTDDYLKQISAEKLVTNPRGGQKWEQIRSDNHYLDAEVYAVACATSLQVHSLKKIENGALVQKQHTRRPQNRIGRRKGLF